MIKECLNCNKEFNAKNTTYRADFCSMECAREHSKIQAKQRLKDTIHNDKHKTNLCAVCGKEFSNGIKRANHTLNYHCLDAKEYYDLCFKDSNQEGKCLYCGKETRFAGLPSGYRKYCSREHEKLYLKENFNATWIKLLMAAASFGLFATLLSNSIIKKTISLNNLYAALISFVVMLIIGKAFAKYKRLQEFSLGIAMLVGMFVAAFFF